MILFFGSRPGKRTSRDLPGTDCPHCGQRGSLSLHAQPQYAHLFWIPIFNLKTHLYAECSHCKRVYYKEEFSPEMEEAARRQ